MSVPVIAVVGLAFTVIVKITGVPVQPLEGVTVIVATIGAFVVFLVVKLEMLPVPDAAKPIAVLLLVQENVAPVDPVKLMAPLGSPAQNWLLPGCVIVGRAVTLIDLVTVVVPQLLVTANVVV